MSPLIKYKLNIIMFANLVDKLFKTPNGKIILSILLGLGLSAIFKRTCNGNGCVIIKAESPDIVKNNIYRFEDKCYKYTPHESKCNVNKIYEVK